MPTPSFPLYIPTDALAKDAANQFQQFTASLPVAGAGYLTGQFHQFADSLGDVGTSVRQGASDAFNRFADSLGTPGQAQGQAVDTSQTATSGATLPAGGG